MDDIYTNRPVLTKHQEEPKITELASITETESWDRKQNCFLQRHTGCGLETTCTHELNLCGPKTAQPLLLGQCRLSSYRASQQTDFITPDHTNRGLWLPVCFSSGPWRSRPRSAVMRHGALCGGDQMSGLLYPACGGVVFGARHTPAGDSSFRDSCGHWVRPREKHQAHHLFIRVSFHSVNLNGLSGGGGSSCVQTCDLFVDSIAKV